MKTKIMFTFFLLLPALAMAEARYFSSDGKEVSESEYQAIAKTWNREAVQLGEEDCYANYRHLMEARHEREWMDVVSSERTTGEEKTDMSGVMTYAASRQKKVESENAEKEISKDVLGRPLKDEQGRWITYADDAKPSYRTERGGKRVVFAPVFFRRSILGW